MTSLRSETLRALGDLVEIGDFASADDALLAAIEAWHRTNDDPAQQLELIRRRVRRSLDDPRPDLSLDEVDVAMDAIMADATVGSGRAAR